MFFTQRRSSKRGSVNSFKSSATSATKIMRMAQMPQYDKQQAILSSYYVYSSQNHISHGQSQIMGPPALSFKSDDPRKMHVYKTQNRTSKKTKDAGRDGSLAESDSNEQEALTERAPNVRKLKLFDIYAKDKVKSESLDNSDN